MRIVVLHERLTESARADERDALVQRDLVQQALQASGHDCLTLAMDLDLEATRRELVRLAPDLVFNLVESLGGSGRLAQLAPALVEALGIPCTGASAAALGVTTDKLRAKRRLAAAGLPTPTWLEDGEVSGIAHPDDPNARFIVKPVHEDASVDLSDESVVWGAASARARLARAPRISFAEAYVEGREFNLALLEKNHGVEVLPPAEILFEAWPEDKPRIVGYAAKWDDASFESVHTPRRFDFPASDARLLVRLGELAHRCFPLFELSGFARIDFRVDAAGEPYILEANANPCLSPDAGFAAAAARAGLSSHDVVERIVAAAFRRPGRVGSMSDAPIATRS